MHASSLDNMQRCYRKYIAGSPLEAQAKLKVLDVGGRNVNGSYADLFRRDNVEFIAVDIEGGAGVDVVLSDPNQLPFEDGTIDVVLCGQMLEHCERFWRLFGEMVRVLQKDGLLILIAPSAGPIHNYPVDCYRFYPDAYRALAKDAGCYLLDVWLDERGPWNDLVGVFNRTGIAPAKKPIETEPEVAAINAKANLPEEVHGKIQGSVHYIQVLKMIHLALQPQNYLEIGVRHGTSLVLAEGNAVGVDPHPELRVSLPETTSLVQQPSDTFFSEARHPILRSKPDLVFIDGMHLFENVLRDFMHVERIASPNTVVVIDDILPNEPEQATRTRNTRIWCGDVWKLYYTLTQLRPDLVVLPIDASPTGMMLVTNLDPTNRVLWEQYNPLVARWTQTEHLPPQSVLTREIVLPANSPEFERCLLTMVQMRNKRQTEQNTFRLGDAITAVFEPPKVSVVVIAYNMARELPRTLRTLSADMQRKLKDHEYEIIVVDNGSTEPFDEELCRSIAPNSMFLYYKQSTPSPVGAINFGLRACRGELLGVVVDGARMASPGLLHAAWSAYLTNPRAVIGSLGFHLGDEVQMLSVTKGYNAAREDALLASVPWESDGYRLFEIAVFAGSSSGGWFSLPAESNALFMARELWAELEGYDARFQQPGGGLANLDVWSRACELSNSSVMILLGEGTFHQVHGGVATNAERSPWVEFEAEYAAIRGRRYERPQAPISFYGENPLPAMKAVARRKQLVSDIPQAIDTPLAAG